MLLSALVESSICLISSPGLCIILVLSFSFFLPPLLEIVHIISRGRASCLKDAFHCRACFVTMMDGAPTRSSYQAESAAI